MTDTEVVETHKRCPFCGKTGTMVRIDSAISETGTLWWVECTGEACEASIGRPEDTEAEAWAAWDKRA